MKAAIACVQLCREILPRRLSTDVMKHLGNDLKSHALLLVGLNFSDWLTRLFLRVSRQDPLSRVTLASWLADGPPSAEAQSMVMFFGGVSRSIKVIECDPAAFASELARRWQERHLSPATESAVGENYFRRERYWASQRAEGYSDAERGEFYLPVLIHPELPLELRQEPRIFSGCQWNHLAGGALSPELGRTVADLQRKYRGS